VIGRILKFQVNNDVLSNAVSFAVRLLNPRNRDGEQSSGVRIDADGKTVKLSVVEDDTAGSIEIVANVETPGSVLIPGRLLLEIVTKLPNSSVSVEAEKNQMNLNCAGSKFTLQTMDISRALTIPVFEGNSGVVDGNELADAIHKVANAAAKDVPMYAGVLFNTSEDKISLLATDRYRVAIDELKWNQGKAISDLDALVPARMLTEIAKTFANQGEVTITTKPDTYRISFSSDNKVVAFALLKTSLPALRDLFPANIEHFAIVNRQELIESIRRAALVVTGDQALVMSFNGENLNIEGSSQNAQVSETVGIELTGEDLKVKLRPHFLLDGISGVTTEFLKIGFTKSPNPNKPGPVLISNHGSKDNVDSYRYLLQPNLL
jgi:DNA polymerase-3 subunit beta